MPGDILGMRAVRTAVLLVLAATAYADNGTENWAITADKVAPKVLQASVGTLTFYGSIEGAELQGFSDRRLKKPRRVKVAAMRPVSIFTDSYSTGPAQGYRFPVTVVSSGALRMVFDVVSGDSVWLERAALDGLVPARLTEFSNPRPFEGINVNFLHEKPIIRRWPSRRSRRVEDAPGGVLKALRHVNGFIELGYGGWEGEPVRSIGWISIKDEEGRLQVWPGYYDDC